MRTSVFSCKKIALFSFALIFWITAFSQTAGDYRSASSGVWATLATWQRYNGASWVTPTVGQGYPGQNTGTGAVTIKAGHVVTIGTGGITTQAMGGITIENTGQLYLTGLSTPVTFTLTTSSINVTAGGSIFFKNKAKLVLITDAIVSLGMATGGLVGDCSNNDEIWIGSIKYAACAGAPGNIFTFSQLMSSGGTLNATPSSNSPICATNTVNLTGAYTGAIGSAVTYSWLITAPGGGQTTSTAQNPTIASAVAGTYTVKLTVSTILSGSTYTNSETIYVTVNPLPTLTGASQAITACAGAPATISLSGLLPSTTFSLDYTIDGAPQTQKTGLVADGSGNSSFTTANLASGDNGRTLRITGITITPTTCPKTFTQDVTLSVWTTGAGTWTGAVSSDWNTAGNWCGGVPTAATDVTIPATSASVPRQPVIGVAGGECKDITISSGATLTVDGTLEVNGNWTNNGTFTPNSGTVSFTSSAAAQTIGGSGTNTFNNLTINNTYSGGGVKAGGNIAVNGTLYLQAANPSATVGALEMVTNYNNYPRTTPSNAYVAITSYVLTMGANATTTGTGDVTGKIYRSSLNANQAYSFGNQYTTYAYTVAPTNVTVIVTIGTAYGDGSTWGQTTAVKRTYEMIPTGGTNARVAMNLHYLDSELNGNTESNLTTGDYDVEGDGNPLGDEHGRSSYDYTNNYIGLSGVPISYFIYNVSTHNWYTIFKLHDYSTGHTVWDGSASTVWMNDANWSNGVPGDNMTAIIPDAATTPNDPILAADQTIGGMQILSGGVLNLNGQTLTINANNYSGWEDQSGTSNYTGSTVIIANTTLSTPILGVPHFDNLTVNSGASITIEPNSHVYISGTLTKTGGFDASTFDNIVEYNGADQTIGLPDDSKYRNLVLSGSGTKTLPVSALTILNDFTLSGTATTTPSDALTVGGVFTLGSGTTFAAGTLTHNFAGNFTNNGGTFTNTGSTINLNGTAAQTLGGSASTTFNNLTINNAAGVTLGIDETVDGTLTFASGLITTGSNKMIVGCSGSIAGNSSARYVNGKLSRLYCSTGSKDFPIGKGGNYRPLTLEYTALTGTSTVIAEQIESTILGTIPANTIVQTGRYWAISQTGGSAFTYDLTLDEAPFVLGSGEAKILRGDGATNEALAASNLNPKFKTTGATTSFGNFAVAASCTPPTIGTQPSTPAAVCAAAGSANISVGASVASGSPIYQWQESPTGVLGTFSNIADGGIYSNATTSQLTITNPLVAQNGYAYRVVVSRDCGSSVTSDAVALTVNALPTFTLGASPTVCSGVTSASLTYSDATNSPDKYSIDYSDLANTAGFSDVTLAALPVSPISLVVPGGATPSTYSGTLTMKNNTTGCVSLGSECTVMIRPLPQGSFTGNTVCAGGTGELTWTATEGTGPFTVVYNDGGDHTANSVGSGVPFDVYGSQAITTAYTLTSVTSTHSCQRVSGFTGGTATVTVATGIWKGTSTEWNDGDNWCGGIPTDVIDVIIPSTVANQPVIGDADGICKSLTIESGASLTISGSNTLTVEGNWINNGTFIPNSSTVIFDGTTTISGTSSNSFNNITINATKSLTAQPENMTVSGNFINSGTFNSASGTIVLNGNAKQTVTGTCNFYDLILFNGTTGTSDLEITTPVTISHSAQFTDGIVEFSGTGALEFTNGSSSDAGTVSSFVNGSVKKTGADAFTFPVGDVSAGTAVWAPIGIAAPTDPSDAFTAEYVFSSPANSTSLGDGLDHISKMEYWNLTRSVGTSTPAVTLYWKDAARSGVSSNYAQHLADLKVAHWNGSAWESKGGSASGTYPIGQVSSSVAFTTYSPITLGSGGGLNILPVELLQFDVACENNKAHISWSTASETDNQYFTIERSQDHKEWQLVSTVEGAGNSNTVIAYSLIDDSPYAGISYYRLKQIDYNGASKRLGTFSLKGCENGDAEEFSIKVSPNPFKTETAISYIAAAEGDIMLTVTDLTGKKVATYTFNGQKGYNSHTIDFFTLTPGLYLLTFDNGTHQVREKLFKSQ